MKASNRLLWGIYFPRATYSNKGSSEGDIGKESYGVEGF